MKHRFVLVLMLYLFGGALFAQSRFAYIGMSALVPGSGEIAMGKTNRGLFLLSSEIIAAYSFFKTDQDMNLQKNRYKRYANEYAGVPLDSPQGHYQYVQEYISSDDYNEYIEMVVRNDYLISNYDPVSYAETIAAESFSGDEQWEWQSIEHWQTYNSMRRKHQKMKINHNLALGIMLLNRAISIVDTALLSRNMNIYAGLSGYDGVSLNCELRF